MPSTNRRNPLTPFGWKVTRALDQHGMTIQDLADEIGCHRSLVSKIMRDQAKSEPCKQQIIKLLGLEESTRIAS